MADEYSLFLNHTARTGIAQRGGDLSVIQLSLILLAVYLIFNLMLLRVGCYNFCYIESFSKKAYVSGSLPKWGYWI